MISSETLDPRSIERALNACPTVAHSCVIGNNFLGKPSDVICILIQPASPKLNSKDLAEITRAVAAINKTLLPPLRIAWSRVGILDNGLAIPFTKKGMIFRKKLEEIFSDFLARLLQKGGDMSLGTTNTKASVASKPEYGALPTSNLRQDENVPLIPLSDKDGTAFPQDVNSDAITKTSKKIETRPQWTIEEVKKSVMETIATVLELESEVLRIHPNTSFAEVKSLSMIPLCLDLISSSNPAGHGLEHGGQNRQSTEWNSGAPIST